MRVQNLRVTSSNPRVMSSNPRVTSSNPRVTSSNSRVTSSNPSSRIIKLNSLKSSSFPKTILLGNLREKLVPSFSGDNLFFYISTTPWLRLQQEAEWVNINFERRDLNSPQKSHLPPYDLEKFAFFFAFNLRKQNATDFSFTPLTQNFALRT